jgi:hypothetical protein
MSKRQQPIPQKAQPPVLMDATVTFHTPKGDIALNWSAANGDVTHNGALIHNTNDLALLHTIAKGMLAAKGKS